MTDERAKVDDWIASWNAKQIKAYDEQINNRVEQERPPNVGSAVLRDLSDLQAKIDFGEHIRRRFPLGTFFDAIEGNRNEARRPSSWQLITAAETGAELFFAAISHINATPEYLDEARARWGPVVDAVLDDVQRAGGINL